MSVVTGHIHLSMTPGTVIVNSIGVRTTAGAGFDPMEPGCAPDDLISLRTRAIPRMRRSDSIASFRTSLALLLLSPLALLAGVADASGADGPGPDVDYARQVKPLLSRHCVTCHGEKRARSGLRLDTAAAALKGGKHGPVILAGRGDESEIVLALRGEGSGEQMPLNRPPLSAIRDRPDQGLDRPRGAGDGGRAAGRAPIVDALGLLPPRRPAPPAVKNEDWVRNPIDRFILARLEAGGSPRRPRPIPRSCSAASAST